MIIRNTSPHPPTRPLVNFQRFRFLKHEEKKKQNMEFTTLWSTCSRLFIKRKTSGILSDNKWRRVTTSDNEWQQVATNANEWPLRLIYLFFQIKEEPTTKHPKENSINLEEDLWFFKWIKSKNKQEQQKQLFVDFHQNKCS